MKELMNLNLNLNPKRKKEVITLIVVFLAVLVVSAFAVYFIAGRQSVPEVPQQNPQISEATREPTPIDRRPVSPNSAENENFLDRLFGTRSNEPRINSERWLDNIGRIFIRLLLATLLGVALAFRPRRPALALKRNPYVAQTQILLAIVAAALMIIVGDNAARAFGIFAAVSLVRFRTNIRDPKEITVLLISLALGLAAGVGRWDLALILTVFTLIVLWILESREPQLVFRALEVKVVTKNVGATQRALRQVFKKYSFDSELREMGRKGEDLGSVVYAVDVSPVVSTDLLSEDILELDEANIEGIEWTQKKNFSYIYQ